MPTANEILSNTFCQRDESGNVLFSKLDVLLAMEKFANQRVKESLTRAAHNACQQLLLEEITPSIAFEVHDTILKQFNQKS